MDDASFRKAFDRLWRRSRVVNWAEGRDPFEILVSIVMSQNSTDAVTERVMRALAAEMPVRPATIAQANAAKLVRILRPAGLAPQKVPRIRQLAREILRRYNGDLANLLDVPTAAAREALMDLPGIGPKTADVWLSLVAERDTMPVDTHIARIAQRWRLVPRARYEDITAKLKELIPPRRRARGHLVLIQFGRDVCQARRPRCEICPVYGFCDADVKRPRAT
ncbi:MAG TPA: endonuclease III [Thermoplasmata archaeon]|nr:endonuclease III [Thermoplasmata archaeon]